MDVRQVIYIEKCKITHFTFYNLTNGILYIWQKSPDWLRLSPNFQTLELRHKFDLIMDKDIYSTLADSRPLIALIQHYLLKIQFTA